MKEPTIPGLFMGLKTARVQTVRGLGLSTRQVQEITSSTSLSGLRLRSRYRRHLLAPHTAVPSAGRAAELVGTSSFRWASATEEAQALRGEADSGPPAHPLRPGMGSQSQVTPGICAGKINPWAKSRLWWEVRNQSLTWFIYIKDAQIHLQLYENRREKGTSATWCLLKLWQNEYSIFPKFGSVNKGTINISNSASLLLSVCTSTHTFPFIYWR